MNTLELRRDIAIGPNGICTPAQLGYGAAHAPFVRDEYQYRARLGQLTEPPWITVMAQPPADLVPVDPFAPSRFRRNGLAVWDAVIGIPTSAIRAPKLYDLRSVPAIRHSNTEWTDTYLNLSRVGPIGPGGTFLRPRGPYILDLMGGESAGWSLLEGAHILAHLRESESVTDMPQRLQQAMAELVCAWLYNIPIDTTGQEGPLARYGLEIVPSTRLRTPVLHIPWMGDGAPVPDRTIGYISVGLFIEPVPHGVIADHDNWLECNRWTCMPTMAVIAGWECVDVVTHMSLGVPNLVYRHSKRLGYIVPPTDLMPAATLPDLLQAAYTARGAPIVDTRYQHVPSWLASEAYQAALLRTPPFPCRDCIAYNARTEGAPKRPKRQAPEEDTPTDRIVRAEWEKAQKRIMSIATKATIFCEAAHYGGRSKATRIRRQRIRHYNLLKSHQKTVTVLRTKIKRAIQNGMLTKAATLQKRLADLPKP